MGGGVSDIFRFAKCEMRAAVFVKFSAYAESERNFALNARSAAHCEAISREPKVVSLLAVRRISQKKGLCQNDKDLFSCEAGVLKDEHPSKAPV